MYSKWLRSHLPVGRSSLLLTPARSSLRLPLLPGHWYRTHHDKPSFEHSWLRHNPCRSVCRVTVSDSPLVQSNSQGATFPLRFRISHPHLISSPINGALRGRRSIIRCMVQVTLLHFPFAPTRHRQRHPSTHRRVSFCIYYPLSFLPDRT